MLEWVATHAVAVALALLFVLPFFFVFLTSVMSDQQTLTKDLWPQTWQWHNYVDVWHTGGFATWWRNTIVYATVGTALTLVSSIPVAYALARALHVGEQSTVVFMMLSSVVAMNGSNALGDHRRGTNARTAAFFPVAVGIGLTAATVLSVNHYASLAGFITCILCLTTR